MIINLGRDLINELEKHGTMAILVTYVPTASGEEPAGGDVMRVQATKGLDNKATARKLLSIAIQLNQHLGLLPADFSSTGHDT